MPNLLRLIVAILAFSAGSPAHANWGHWRGDDGNGVATEATPPTEWSSTKNVKWKVSLPGRGSGSPVVWDSQLFVTTAIPADGSAPPVTPQRQRLDFVLMCIDRQSGKTIWQRTAITATPSEGTHSTNGFASASPCTDGQHVYAHFGSQGLFCFTMDGEPVWNRDFGDMRTRAGFGEGSSPTIAGDMIIVPWDHEGPSALFALNKKTGEEIWSEDREEPTCWATPLVIEHDGKKQVIMNGQNSARAYDLETGDEIWRCGGQTTRPVASAVAGNGLVFIGSGYQGYFMGAFSPAGEGNIRGTKNVAWTTSRNTPDIASPLLVGNRLYFYKGKTGLLSCLDASSGNPHYVTKRTGLNRIYASPVAAGGHVYLTDREGKTAVIKESSTFELVAMNDVGETVDATPAPVGNQLFLRGERNLFCIEN